MIYLEKNDVHSTLTTWLYCHFWMMWSAEQQGQDAYIHWPKGKFLKCYEDDEKFEEKPNAYNWYFVHPPEKAHIPAVHDMAKIWTWETWKDPSPVPFMAQPLSVIKEYYKKHLHFSDAVEERGQALVKSYGIDFKNTIGITWRGTDNVTDGRPRLPIDTYFPFIDDILKDNPKMRIMATAEEQTILWPLLERYPHSFEVKEFYSSALGSKHNPERFSPMSGFERGMQPALMVWLFSKCAHYIKNRSSTGAVASWLSSGRIVNLAHEETLSYVKMDDQVEIGGIKYPLYDYGKK